MPYVGIRPVPPELQSYRAFHRPPKGRGLRFSQVEEGSFINGHAITLRWQCTHKFPKQFGGNT
jgi:hypothetical protein